MLSLLRSGVRVGGKSRLLSINPLSLHGAILPSAAGYDNPRWMLNYVISWLFERLLDPI